MLVFAMTCYIFNEDLHNIFDTFEVNSIAEFFPLKFRVFLVINESFSFVLTAGPDDNVDE